jgi:hypothetical protein
VNVAAWSARVQDQLAVADTAGFRKIIVYSLSHDLTALGGRGPESDALYKSVYGWLAGHSTGSK